MASQTERPTATALPPQMVTARRAAVSQMERPKAMELPPPRVPPMDTGALPTATAAAHRGTAAEEEGKTAVPGVAMGVAATTVAPGDPMERPMVMELQATPTGPQVATDRQLMERPTAMEPLQQTVMALPAVVSQMEHQMITVPLPQTAMALPAMVDQMERQMATALLQQMVTALLTVVNQTGPPADMERPAMARRINMVPLPQIVMALPAMAGQTEHRMVMAPQPQMATALQAITNQMVRGGAAGMGGTRCRRRKR